MTCPLDRTDAPAALRLLAAVDATWPPAETLAEGGWVVRRGAGGGKRVSAASSALAGALPDPAAAVAAMARWAQPPLFRLGEGEDALDGALSAAGYRLIDPVVIRGAPVGRLVTGDDETARLIRLSTALALAEEIWAAGGIGPGRLAVMARVEGPKTALLAREGDRPVGVAFVACDGDIAMIHAMEVLSAERRRGAGRRLVAGAANWAAEHGAAWLALAVTEANGPALALYDRLGMGPLTRYHYRGTADWLGDGAAAAP